MASIEVRELANDERSYRIVWREDGRRRTATFYDLHEAKDFKIAVERNSNHVPADWTPKAELLAGAAGRAARIEATRPPTLLEAALAHTASKNTKSQPEHRVKMRRNFQLHLGDLGAMRVDEVTRRDVQAWCDALAAEDYKYKTIKNLRSDLSTVFKFLVRDDVVARNPAEGTTIDADPDDARDAVFLAHWELNSLVGFLAGEDRVYVELLAGTGARKGEVMILRVGDLELGRGAIPAVRIHRSLKHGHDGQHRIGKTKTKAGMRTVVIDDDLAAMLREHVAGRAPGDLVFPEHGNDGTWQRNVWSPAREAAGLVGDRRPTIHDLRHSHASWLLAEGHSLFAVSKRLGHKKMSTTSDLYGHLDQAGDADLANAFGQARARARRAQLHVV
jgi:integrase